VVLDRWETVLVHYFDWLAHDLFGSCDRSLCSLRLVIASLASGSPSALHCCGITLNRLHVALNLDHHLVKPEIGWLRWCNTGADHFSVKHAHLQFTFHLYWHWDISALLWAFWGLRYQVRVIFFWRDRYRFFDRQLERRLFLTLEKSCQVELILARLSSLYVLVLKGTLTEWGVLVNTLLHSSRGITELCEPALLASHHNRRHWTSLTRTILLWACTWWSLKLLGWSYLLNHWI
jgi:hypothetical protein